MSESFLYAFEDIDTVVQDLYRCMQECSIMTLEGPLGAGKTTLLKNIFAAFGVREPITSPTFAYMNVYKTPTLTVYHFDLYRLHSLEEFMVAGFDEYLRLPNSKVFIEWPEIIEPLLKHQVCQVKIDYCAEDVAKRVLTYEIID